MVVVVVVVVLVVCVFFHGFFRTNPEKREQSVHRWLQPHFCHHPAIGKSFFQTHLPGTG